MTLNMSNTPDQRTAKRIRQSVTLVIGLILFVVAVQVVASFWPIGPDYYFTFNHAALKVINNESRLYDDHPDIDFPTNPDAGYFNPPWLMIVLIPLALLTVQTGQAVLTVGSIVAILVCISMLQRVKPIPVYAIALAIANLHTFDMLIRGQIDVFILAGVVLGWWAVVSKRPYVLTVAFALISIKPNNLLLPIAVLLLGIRQWPWQDKLKAISLPIICVILSGFLIGFDWPLRYLHYVAAYPPNDYLSTSIWRGFAQIGLPTWLLIPVMLAAVAAVLVVGWRVGVNQWTIALAVTTNLAFATYVHGNHYVLLIPAFIYVARSDWRLALLAYLTTFTPLLRNQFGFTAARIDVIYPLILLLSLWVIKLRVVKPNGIFAFLAEETAVEQRKLRFVRQGSATVSLTEGDPLLNPHRGER